MMLLKAAIILWLSIIRTSFSQYSDFPEPWEPPVEGNLCYRPWEKNETSAAWVSLEGMGLEIFSSSFRLHFNELPLWLVLDGNKITNLYPEPFKTLGEQLTYVSLARNQISNIETGVFGYLKKLRVLDLDDNPVELNRAIGIPCDSASLESLYLRNCGLYSFNLPSCENSLTHLYLSGNELEVFYTKSDSLMTHLYLNNNKLRYVTLSQFDWLVHLDLSNNQLNGIARLSGGDPVSEAENYEKTARGFWSSYLASKKQLYLDRAAALQYLIVSSNNIAEIEPDTFVDMNELVHVDISGNKISQLQTGTFERLLQLQDLLLDGNQISKIDRGAFVDLPELKLISLKNNKIENINGNLFAELNSRTNNISLFLDNNEINTLVEGSFRGMTGLAHLGLAGNRIKTILSQAFVDLPYIRSVVIENQWPNQSRTEIAGKQDGLIGSNAFFNLSNLISITIRGSLFTEIGAEAFAELPILTTIDLLNNTISEISPRAFKDLPKIEELNLQSNELLIIQPETFPKSLKRLNLAWNWPREDFNTLNILDLRQLEELDVSGTIKSFRVDELFAYPRNLTIKVRWY